MADVFVSYSRVDRQFVGVLAAALEREGREVWVDLEDIPVSAEWMQEIHAGIDAAGAVVCVLSPDFAASDVCRQEVAHAAKQNKRLIPLLHRAVDPRVVPAALAARHWLTFPAADGFDTALRLLLQTLDTDLAWTQTHARLLVRALEWEGRKGDESYLLRGADLAEAEEWQAQAPGRQELPTDLHARFLRASREAQAREMERLRELYERALSRQLAAQAELIRSQRPGLLQRSVLLAVESMRRLPSLEADLVLRQGVALLPRPVAQFRHGGPLWTVAFTPDGRHLGSAGDDGTARLWSTAARSEAARVTHAGAAVGLAFDGSGARMATAGMDGTARVCEVPTGREVAVLRHPERVRAVAMDRGGTRVATCCYDNAVRVWAADTGEELCRMDGQEMPWHADFSPDGELLAVAGWDGVTRVWNVAARTEVARVEQADEPLVVRFSPDGRYLATGGNDASARIWERENGRVITHVRHSVPGMRGSVHGIAFTADGERFATVSTDGTARVWVTATGRELLRFGHGDGVHAVAFSPDASRLATGSGDGTARVWDVATGVELARVEHGALVSTVAFSPDGDLLASGSWNGIMRVWTVAGEVGRSLPCGAAVHQAAYSVDGAVVVAKTEGNLVHLWPTGGGPAIPLTHPGMVGWFLFVPGGERLVTLGWDGCARVWEMTTGREIEALAHPRRVWAASVSGDGAFVATALFDHPAAYLWSLREASDPVRLAADGQVRDVAFSPDASRVAGVGDDRTVRMWEAATGQEAWSVRLPRKGSTLAFSPRGDLLAVGGYDRVLHLLDPDTGAERGRLTHDFDVSGLAFAPDGRRLAVRGFSRKGRAEWLVWLWDMESGQEVARLAHEDRVHDVAFSPDGGRLATASQDGTARVWDAATGRELTRVAHADIVYSAAFSPDGRSLVTGCGDGRVKISPVAPDDLVAEACARMIRNLTPAEWQLYLPGEPYRATCPDVVEEVEPEPEAPAVAVPAAAVERSPEEVGRLLVNGGRGWTRWTPYGTPGARVQFHADGTFERAETILPPQPWHVLESGREIEFAYWAGTSSDVYQIVELTPERFAFTGEEMDSVLVFQADP